MLTLTLTGPVETQNDLATHWTWQTTDGQYKIVRTIPSADGLRPGFVPVHRCAAGGFMPLDRDRDGSSKRYRTLADAVAAVKSHSKAAGNPYSDDNADATVAAARAIDLADIPRRPISEAQLAAQQRFTAAAQCRGTWTHYECPQCSFDQKINPLTVKAGQPPACPKCFSTMQPLADREALADANGIDKTCTACGHNWRDDGSHKTICPNCHRAKMSLTREALNYLDTPPDVP